MRVESQAGKFVLSFEEVEPGQPGDAQLVITGRMGVWEATTTMELAELLRILKLTLRPRVLAYMVRSVLRGGLRGTGKEA